MIGTLAESDIKPFFVNISDRFINREFSWLAFNKRVLQQADDLACPLLERVRFLSISANNLDEFYMVRVAGLKDQVRHQVSTISQDGLTPSKQLKKIHESASELMQQQQQCWLALKKELQDEHILVVEQSDLSKEDVAWLYNYFMEEIFPVLTPMAVDPAHPFPFLPNLGLAMLVQLQQQKSQKHSKVVIPVPQQLRRFILLPGSVNRFVLLENILSLFQDSFFPDRTITDAGFIRVTRDSELEVSEEAEDLVSHFESAVKRRRKGSVIRLKASANLSQSLLDFAAKELEVHKDDIFHVEGMLGLSSLNELLRIDRQDLKFSHYEARFPERILDFKGDCFAAISHKDILVHHPYESFDVVLRFLQQAARDPDVVAIKQTLYRTNNDSEVVEALIDAAENGKSVTAVVELKARFDEEANIKQARDLERAGVHVVYGMTGLKAHVKLSLVVRKKEGKLCSYVHYATGNYHPVTAKVYSDLSFFTCDATLCRDASYIFNYLTGYSPPEIFEKVSMAPVNLRSSVMSLIDKEIQNAQKGKPSGVWVKANALIDKELIDKLYYASQQGVKIELIVRGVCGLRPGIAGFSDNIRVRSIIGRFLEHSRIFCFANGHALPSPKAKVFIASADWMHRNMERRVEVMVPIENPTVHEQVLGQIMWANLKDNQNAWFLHADGSYSCEKAIEDAFSAQQYFMTNPSLSGRGKALKRGRSKYPHPLSANKE